MQTTDLDLARALLFANKDATLVAVRGDEIITVTDRGVKPLLRWVLDHKNLNEVLPCNPTAENIARWVCERSPACFKVEVQESEGNTAVYEEDQ